MKVKPDIFVVDWCRGPVDDLQQGEFEVTARSVHEAAEIAEVNGLAPEDINGIVRKSAL